MKVNAIWDLRICKDLMESSDLSNELDALLDAVHCAHADHACMNYCDDLFYQVINDEYFSDWLYDKNSDPEIISQKRDEANHPKNQKNITLLRKFFNCSFQLCIIIFSITK